MGCTDDRQCKDCGQAQHARPRRGLFHFKRLVHCWVIFDGDVILVDRAIKPRHGHIVVAVVDGAFTCKKLWLRGGKLKLMSANSDYPDIIPQEGQTIEVWGVVLASVKRFNT
jgi:SOS-response transcriptional repressor LexA